MRSRSRGILAGALGCLLLPVTLAVPAHATEQGPCGPETYYKVAALGSTTFAAVASPAGKYNDSPSTANLSYTLTTTKTSSSSVEVGGTLTIGGAIAKVEASTSFDVTSSVSSGKSVTDTLPVPGHYRGFDQPGVLRRRFHITKWHTLTNCSESQIEDSGTYNMIVGWPFFASCVTTAPSCTPRY
ncbi:hypothetical protein [Kribbella sp. NPDC006257]|uniref:hypothetical protein n=1 Tax=Kribbella sp. NPDC006257 TaxID=3156738 RepID=UPI0033A96E56